jgi:hypothetical protein
LSKKSERIWCNDIPLIAEAMEQQQEGEKIHNDRLCDERPSFDGLRVIKRTSEDWWDQMILQ